MILSPLRRAAFVAACAAALTILSSASATPVSAQPPAGEDLTVHVLTFGPGDHPFFRFGHNAIWIQPRNGQGMAFNFGTFQFSSDIIARFLRGRMTYWLSVSPIEDTLASYEADNRTIEAQELDLTPDEKRTLLARLLENARPENRAYLYDYFWDNCSTRVRDAIDGVVGGQVRQAGQAPAEQTFRQHALRMTADLVPVYLGLHAGLGSLTDAPRDVWSEAFLPERLRDLLRGVRVQRADGERPLVKAERVIFKAQRPPLMARPPQRAPWFGLIGLGLGGGFLVLGTLARRRPAARVALGICTSVVGLVLGLLGLILVLLWVATNHKAAHANANIFLCAPWALGLVGWGVSVARGRSSGVRRAYWIALSALGLALLGVVVKAWPGFSQDNTLFVALLLPVWAGLALGLRNLRR